jgi:subtilisin family serine protease
VAIRPLSLAILMLALLLPEVAAATTPTRIIVKREPGLSAAERADIRAGADVRYVEPLPLPRTEVVAAPRGELREALRELNADPDVAYAEPDRLVHAGSDDEHFNLLWGLENLGDTLFGGVQAEPDADMDVPEAWTLSTGKGRTVAVLDTGVDDSHPDLAGRVLPGYDWVDDDFDADDEGESGHGTHVAGILAATKDNQIGVAGVAPKARILPLRVIEENGSGRVSDIIKAYDFAAKLRVRVVNASFGAPGFMQAEYDAIARHPTTVFVAGAGNSGTAMDDPAAADPQNDDEYPCAYNLPNIVCVGASQPDDEPLSSSNHGAQSVDVFAPGYEIHSTVPGDDYAAKSGTSMATAYVSGAAALLLARNPKLTIADLKHGLIAGSDPKPALENLSVSDGRANAYRPMAEILDHDGDALQDGLDNCPAVHNADQADSDGDGIGDACDLPSADADGDRLLPPTDQCPDEAAAYAADGCPGLGPDADGDGLPYQFDNCPLVGNANQADGDKDGIGDACDADLDNDKVVNGSDNCPVIANPTQLDRDRDGRGDACDPTPAGHDNDRDGVLQIYDACPNVWGTLANGCPAPPPPPPPPPNRDGDDRIDSLDSCPTEYAISNDGCPLPQIASLSGKVRKRGTRRSLTVRVLTTRLANVRVTIERKRGKRWKRVKRRRTATVANRASVAAPRVRPGRYRVRVTISSGAGRGTPASKRFRVR